MPKIAFSLLLAFLGFTPLLSAQTTFSWNGGTGFWYDGPNWSPNGVPNSASADVRIDNAAGSNSVVTLGYNSNFGTDWSVGRLRIDAGDLVQFGTAVTSLTFHETAFAGAGALQVDGTLALPYGSGRLAGPKTISGSGRLVLGATGQRPTVFDRTVNSAVIEGTAAFGAANSSNFPVLNSGTIDANLPGQNMDFHGLSTVADRSANTGLMRSTNGGQLSFGQGWWNNAGGTIQASGTGVNGSGQTVDSVTGFYRGGFLEGGEIGASGGGTIQIGGNFPGGNGGYNFKDVTFSGPVSVIQDLRVAGTITNNGSVALPAGSIIDLSSGASAVTFNGSGEFVLNADFSDRPQLIDQGFNQQWTFQGVTVRGRGNVGYISAGGAIDSVTVLNRGRFVADRPGQPLHIDVAAFDNQSGGLLRAEGGGILRMVFNGPLQNTGGTIEATSGGRIEASAARIEGGLLRNTGGFISLAGLTLVNPGTGMRLEGDLKLGADGAPQEANLIGAIENTGLLRVASTTHPAILRIGNSPTRSASLTGGGVLQLGDAANGSTASALSEAFQNSETYTLNNLDHTIRGFGRIGEPTYDRWLVLNNTGLVAAETPGKTLQIELFSANNSGGTFRASGGGVMNLFARFGFANTGAGKVEALADSTVRFYSTSISGGLVSSAVGGTVAFADSNTARDGVVIANAGTALFGESGGTRSFDGLANGGSSLINSGTIRKVNGGDYSVYTSLNSTGTIEAQAGILRFFGGGAISGGTQTASLGTDLTFQNTPYTFGGINLFTGAGTHWIAGTSAVLADAATELRTANLNLYEATVTGSGLLSHSGLLRFYVDSANTISGARLLTLPGATAAIEVRGRPLLFTDGASWENRGLISFRDYPHPRLNGAVGTLLDNTATGIVRSEVFNFGFGILDMPSRNAGRIEVTAGRMSVEKPSQWINGTATLAPDTELHFWNPITFSGTGNTSTGAGQLYVGNVNGALVFQPGSRFTADRIQFHDGSDAAGAGELRIIGALGIHPYSNTTVFDATQVQLLAGSTNRIEFNNGTFRLQNGALLRNAGTLESRAAVYLELNTGAVLENAGLMTVTSGGNNPGFGGDNTGLFRTTEDSVTRYFPSNGNSYTIGWPFDFAGILYADSGMNLTFDRGGLFNETAKLWPNHPASNISFTGATPFRARGRNLEFSGTGYVNFVGTTLQFEPSSIPGNETRIAAGARVAFHGNNLVRGQGTLVTTGFVFQNGDQIVEQNAILQTQGTADVSVWNATGRKVQFKTGAQFLNGGRFVLQSQVGGAGEPGFTGEPGTLFHNQLGGTLVHDNGGTTQFDLDFRNDGELDVRAGRFEFLKTFSGTGGIAASGGGKVTLPLGSAALSQLPNSLRATGAGSEINLSLPGGDKFIRIDVDGGRLVAAGGGHLVAAGAGNILSHNGGVLQANGLSLVAAGAGNITAQGLNTLLSVNNLVGQDGGTLVGQDGGTLVAAGSLNLVNAGGMNLTGAGTRADIAGLVGMDHATLVTDNGAGLVNAGGMNLVNGSQVIARDGASVLSDNGLGLTGSTAEASGIGARIEASQLIGNDSAGFVGLDGGTLVAAGSLNRPGFAARGLPAAPGDPGTIVVANGSSLAGNGTFQGIGYVQTGSVLRPGHPTTGLGALTWTGALTVEAGARLEVQLGGTTAGTQHDRINLSGAFALNGQLVVSFVSGFGATVGPADVFDLVVSQVSATSSLTGTRVPVVGSYGSFLVSVVNGGKTLRLSNFQIDPITFSRWAQRFGLEGANAAPMADPFGSGLSNLMKYALGLDPSQPGGRGPVAGVVTDGQGNRYLTLSYTKPAGAETPTDLLYLPERTAHLNPAVWSAASGDVVPAGDPVPGPGALQTVTVRSTHPTSGQTHESLRLRVTLMTP